MAANSGIQWIDTTFNISVKWLYDIAGLMGITYEEINVWIFCIAWPLVTIGMAVWIILLKRALRNK